MMGIFISITITVGLFLNLILLLKEGKDERWNHIINGPLNIAFSLLFMGYTVGIILSGYFHFDLTTYKMYYDYLFCGALVLYIVLLLMRRRTLS
ncbi:hypothetical protein ACIFOE_17560 [Paenibacillus sp. NRS-1783]|uniref:hypothetical protein n=1 Tax=unclassified Paenibacillus TaxID=185978 RepID=UPI003D28A46A